MLDYEYARQKMVQNQVAKRGVTSSLVLGAMGEVPRERFVDPGMEEFAYDDTPLPIGSKQTISQPFIVAKMIEMAAIQPGDKVLEVGAGSGYAAAVISRIAGNVYTIERHARLAEGARERIEAVGYDNIHIRTGDGTRGWPEEAPFDAIVVPAGSPAVPSPLREQLDIGGRLIIPLGEDKRSQRLTLIKRLNATAYEETDLGSVAFVPLVGGNQWPETTKTVNHAPNATLPHVIARAAEELPEPEIDSETFGAIFDRLADRRVVLLGEASHGTAEFYKARAAITRRLVERHGFNIVAVEADWPDAAAVDRYVKGLPPRKGVAPPFRRFPVWMWRNTDMDQFINWMKVHNAQIDDPDRQTRLYGLDIYNMGAAIETVLDYLDRVDPEAAASARERYGCLTPWQREPSTYGRAVLTRGYRNCEEEVVAQCRDLLARELSYAKRGGESYLDAVQSARLVSAAERYYRIMYYGGADAWNLRDRHMFDTLLRVLEARGPKARAVVWAHNSHIGDARHTEMGQVRAEVNIGQLCREHFGRDAALVGFGTHEGTVAAADTWGGPMRVKSVRPSNEESFESLFHATGGKRFLVDFAHSQEAAQRLAEMRLERFIGVIYSRETELESHYALASLSRQFDIFVWIDQTNAITPLDATEEADALPDTFPFAL